MRPALLAIGGGLLLALASPSPLSVEPIAALAPLGLAALLRAERQGGTRSFALGLLASGLVTLYWLVDPLEARFGLPAVTLWPLIAAYSAAYPLGAVWLAGRWRRALPLTVPALWALAEWARGWILGGFDWLSLGYTQVHAELTQHLIGLLGVYLTSAVVVGLGVLMAHERKALVLGGLGLTAALAFTPCPCSTETSKTQGVRVAVLDHHHGAWTGRAAALADARFGIAPEGALGRDAPPSALPWPVLAGAVERCPRRSGRRCERNAVMHLAMDGTIEERYAKRNLVPLWEADFLGIEASPTALILPGESPGLIEIGGLRAGVLICYEVADAALAAELKALGAQVLVHPTSDLWQSTRVAADQHRSLARARALETALPVIRVSDRGLSARIDAHGRWSPVIANSVVNVTIERIP